MEKPFERSAYRVLVVDDFYTVRKYSHTAFKGFQVVHAFTLEDALKAVKGYQRRYPNEPPFHLLSCDVNMPKTNDLTTYSTHGLAVMRWIHKRYPKMPVICHSDDFVSAARVKFARFVPKLLRGMQSDSFYDELRLRKAAFEAIEGRKSYEHLIEMAMKQETVESMEDMDIPTKIRPFVKFAKATQDFSWLFSVTQAHYLTEQQLLHALRFALHPSQ